MKKSIITLVLAAMLGISLMLSGCCHMHRSQCAKPACCEKPCCAKPCCAQKSDCPKAPADCPRAEEKK